MAEAPYKDPVPWPLYVLVILAIALCAFFCWIGTVFVRLWFYKGALGPEPEKFIILRKDLKDRYHKTMLTGDSDDLEQSHGNRSTKFNERRITVFPHVAPLDRHNPDTAQSTALDPRRFSTLPTINIQEIDDLDEFEDPQLRSFVAEQVRISRLPAFVQDDCGDGSEFPDIPIALSPIEEHTNNPPTSTPLTPDWQQRTDTYLRLGLQKVDRNAWLTVDNTYIEYQSARDSLLAKKRSECIHVTPDSEAACEELMHEVVEFLVDKYPHHFCIRTKDRRKHVRNELTQEEYSLVRPFDHHPLEVCARLAMEDFQILVKGEFSMQWYLQASATLFPAGWHMRAHIGKTLDAIVSNRNEPMPLWEDLPSILTLPSLSPYSFAPSLLSRTQTYIQTQPDKRTLSDILHIQRPADFFSGNIFNLAPKNLLVRRETQVFRRLPKSGAVVVSTKTSTRRLVELGREERGRLLDEVGAWSEDEARFKGRDLWVTAVEGFCLGRAVFRDDVTVFSRGCR